ncbi:hypothetical protein A9X05_03810 [Mycobacterium sp. E3298]|nr:glycosyltransferase family A protein [Mycobacterium sp. E3298]OBG70326.1 hypothetical protein A9X05_03810 [Mycobacterium sp. E3298]
MKLSIIIPAYNVERYITRTLDSLARQTDPRFETLIVDDGSTDGTAAAVQAFLAEGSLPGARLIRTRNGGVSRARNRGLQEAQGEYVVFLDGDDEVEPELVEFVRAALRSGGEPQAVAWRFLEVDEEGHTLLDFYADKPPQPETMSGSEAMTRILFRRSLRIPMGGIAFQRQLLADRGIAFAPDCVNGEDQEFIFKGLACCGRVAFIDRPLFRYVQRGSSISYAYNVRKFDYVGAFARAAAFIDGLNAGRDEQLAAISHTLNNRHTVENYFYNLETCLNSGARPSLRRLLRDIDRAYPRLNREMKMRIRRYYKEQGQMTHTIRGFLILPELYQAIKGLKLAAAQRRARAV